jgi:hypothetical protein
MNWPNQARAILKAELARKSVTYQRLAARLYTLGVEETERSIANKMSRGTFSFIFFLQCMKAVGVKSVDVDLQEDTPPVTSPKLRKSKG